MIIEQVLAAPGLTGFFFDDQLAIKMGAEGKTAPLTAGARRLQALAKCASAANP